MMINHQVWDIPDFQTHPLSQQNRGIQAAWLGLQPTKNRCIWISPARFGASDRSIGGPFLQKQFITALRRNPTCPSNTQIPLWSSDLAGNLKEKWRQMRARSGLRTVELYRSERANSTKKNGQQLGTAGEKLAHRLFQTYMGWSSIGCWSLVVCIMLKRGCSEFANVNVGLVGGWSRWWKWEILQDLLFLENSLEKTYKNLWKELCKRMVSSKAKRNLAIKGR